MTGKKNARFPNHRKRLSGGTHILTSTKKYEANQRSRSQDLTEGKERPNQINSSKNG
jgi:hypothetical protein